MSPVKDDVMVARGCLSPSALWANSRVLPDRLSTTVFCASSLAEGVLAAGTFGWLLRTKVEESLDRVSAVVCCASSLAERVEVVLAAALQ